MSDTSRSQSDIRNELVKRLRNDSSFTSGKILGSFCTQPHPFAVELFSQYIDKNLGDPGLVPGTLDLEKETIRLFGKMLHDGNATGRVTSGASEANFLALWNARTNKVSKRTVLLSDQAHFSFQKEAKALDMSLKYIPSDETGKVDIHAMEQEINDDTAILIGIAGTTARGAVDNIPAIAKLGTKYGIPVHVDAALGGMILPFLPETEQRTSFDFKNGGVTSIALDPHKMGMAPIPTGVILFRSGYSLGPISTAATYLSGGAATHLGITGTRPGASVISLWGLLQHLGHQGYKDIVEKALTLTRYAADQIKDLEAYQLVSEPELNVIAFKPSDGDVDSLEVKLRQKGWQIGRHSTHLKLAIMPHVTLDAISAFLAVLQSL